MSIATENVRRNLFIKLLLDLAKDTTILSTLKNREKIYFILERIYAPISEGGEYFRHFYSDIFSTLSKINNETNLGDSETLGQNVQTLRFFYDKERLDSTDIRKNVSKNLRKLYDHLSLDMARMAYTDSKDREVSQEDKITDLKAKVSSLESAVDEVNSKQNDLSSVQEDLKNAKTSLDESQNKIENIQKEYIAILGIFASIVLAFNAGITFSASVFENMHQSSIYRVVLIVLLLGLVLTNSLYILFNQIRRLSDPDGQEKGVTALKVSNVVFISLMLVLGFLWLVGCVESRNDLIFGIYQ